MVVMVGGRIVPDGSNYNTILTTTGGPAHMSEEKEEVESVEAEVLDDDDDDGNEFSNFVENQLPMAIREEGTPAKADPPGGVNSPAVQAAKAAVAAAVANIGDADEEDDGGGKPAAKQRAPRTPAQKRTEIDPDKDSKWLAIVDQLKEFKRLNGHCNGKLIFAFFPYFILLYLVRLGCLIPNFLSL